MRLTAEVSNRLQPRRSCQGLLYAPLEHDLACQSTRVYELEFTGDSDSLTAFIRRVLVDAISQDLRIDSSPAYDGYSFCLEYGMKPGALDLEKEAILSFYAGRRKRDFEVQSLKTTKRLYIFGEKAHEASPTPFVRDIVNPAIHTWKITNANSYA